VGGHCRRRPPSRENSRGFGKIREKVKCLISDRRLGKARSLNRITIEAFISGLIAEYSLRIPFIMGAL